MDEVAHTHRLLVICVAWCFIDVNKTTATSCVQCFSLISHCVAWCFIDVNKTTSTSCSQFSVSH